MATTIFNYRLTGATKFPVNFEYLARRFVKVSLVGSSRLDLVLNVDYRFTSKMEIETTKAWTAAQGFETIEIKRVTSATERLVNFTDGSILRSYDLNTSQIQAVHIAEEGRDIAEFGIQNNSFYWDANGIPIRNLGYPSNPGDAASLEYVTNQLGRTLRAAIGEALNEIPSAAVRAGKILAFDSAGNPVGVLPESGSAADVMVQLAGPNGLDYIGYDYPQGSPLVYGIRGILSQGYISLWEPRFTDKCVKPDPANPKTWDWAPAWAEVQKHMIALATAQNSTYGLPQVRVPGYAYKFRAAIKTVPWIKVAFHGPSIWDFKEAPKGFNHVTITNSALAVPTGGGSFTGTCLDGSAGGCLITGHGLTQSTDAGLFIGNSADGGSVTREVALEGISVSNCYKGVEFGKYGTYLGQMTNCRIENNWINIMTPSGTVKNSGERMVWDRCILAGSGSTNGFGGLDGAALHHRCDTFDMLFTNTSFDFNYDVFHLAAGCTYAAITALGCHFEGWDNFLVHWKSGGANVYVNIDVSTVLPTTYRVPNAVVMNSPSRPLVKFDGTQFSRCEVYLTRPIVRYTSKPWTEDPFMSIDTNPSEDPSARRNLNVTGLAPYSFSCHGTRNSVANMDFDFQKDPVGTLGTALTCWEKAGSSNTDNGVIADDNGKKVLRIKGTDFANYYTIKGKQWTNVMPNTTAYVWAALSKKGLTQPDGSSPTRPVAEVGVELKFADGTIRRGAYVAKLVGSQFADPQMPNFAEGDARYIACDSQGTLLPQGVVAVRPYVIFTGFVGDLNVSRVGVWFQ